MGIYFQHGIEYLVIYDSDHSTREYATSTYKGEVHPLLRAVSVIGQDKTDDRLVNTKYYTKQKDAWYRSANTHRLKLSEEDLYDFPITDAEKELIENISADEKLSTVEHGWYDVHHVSCTY
jgi:hypothetical protein